MSRMVHCVKFGREMEGMERPPFKGEMGARLFEKVSREGWRMWLEHSKMLVNEYRLDLTSEQGQKVWMTECEKFFFGEGSQLPPDFVPGGQAGGSQAGGGQAGGGQAGGGQTGGGHGHGGHGHGGHGH